MKRLKVIDPKKAEGKGKILLEEIQDRYGMIPNIMRTMSHSPSVLEAYLVMNDALSGGALSPKLREQLALVVSEKNGCDYCLASHSAVGQMVGLSEEEVSDSRRGISTDSKVEAALRFASQVVDQRGRVADGALEFLRKHGYSDGEIVEIVANVALTLFTNYFNQVAGTPVDFPEIPVLEPA